MSTPSAPAVARRVSPRRHPSAAAAASLTIAAAAAASASTRMTTMGGAAAAALALVPMTPPRPGRSGPATGTVPPPRSVSEPTRTSRYFSPSLTSKPPPPVESSSTTFSALGSGGGDGGSRLRRSPRGVGRAVPVTPLASSSSSSLEDDDVEGEEAASDGVGEDLNLTASFAAAAGRPSTSTPTRRKTKQGATMAVKGKTKRPAAAVSTGKKGGKRKTPDAASEESGGGVEVARTSSFGPLWAGSLRTATVGTGAAPSTTTTASSSGDHPVAVHTLILGTHPSVTSLSETRYYAHPMNAFWWIAGDALGFRRATGVSPSSDRPYKFTTALRHGAGDVLPYERQVEVLTSRGFAMWDLIGSCQREGSLDQDIREEVPNDVREFCAEHREVRRIVLANGAGKQLQLFLRHFRDWWDDDGEGGEDGAAAVVLVPGESVLDKMSKKYAQRREALPRDGGIGDGMGKRFIEVEAPISVSPAAARSTYEEKRDDWERCCYVPGLRDHERLRRIGKED